MRRRQNIIKSKYYTILSDSYNLVHTEGKLG